MSECGDTRLSRSGAHRFVCREPAGHEGPCRHVGDEPGLRGPTQAPESDPTDDDRWKSAGRIFREFRRSQADFLGSQSISLDHVEKVGIRRARRRDLENRRIQPLADDVRRGTAHFGPRPAKPV